MLVRYLTIALVDGEPFPFDEVEITQAQFETMYHKERKTFGECHLDYERHTVRENGASQIFLTIVCNEYPHVDELNTIGYEPNEFRR